MGYYLAIDIGASSGRHVLGHVADGKIQLEEVHRFENGLYEKNGHRCWDTEMLFREIINGMKKCAELSKIPISIGIDTWGVDFVLLDADGVMLGDSVAYRDGRTKDMDTAVEEIIPFDTLYGITGIQKQIFNTVYQLMAVKKQQPDLLQKAESLLMMPDYLNYLLTGVKKQEYTIATTTALVNAESKAWDKELLQRLGYPQKLFGPLSAPGTAVGPLTPEIRSLVGFQTEVLLPASHDTGSAYLAVPAKDEHAVTISSGTWSLLGLESPEPLLTERAKTENFTNEGGYGYRYRFLKNIMGLWMIQSVRRELHKKYSYAQLEAFAKEHADFPSVVDVNKDIFLAPDSMIEAIRQECRDTGQKVPEAVGKVVQCIYQSLSGCYADAVRGLSKITDRQFTGIHIVGGGSKDSYLNALTAEKTGLPVYAGPTEGTVIGNLMAQMLRGGEITDLKEARKSVQNSFHIIKYEGETV